MTSECAKQILTNNQVRNSWFDGNREYCCFQFQSTGCIKFITVKIVCCNRASLQTTKVVYPSFFQFVKIVEKSLCFSFPLYCCLFANSRRVSVRRDDNTLAMIVACNSIYTLYVVFSRASSWLAPLGGVAQLLRVHSSLDDFDGPRVVNALHVVDHVIVVFITTTSNDGLLVTLVP